MMIVAAEIERSGGALAIAAYNGPEHYVISGPRPAIEAALARLETTGVRDEAPARVVCGAFQSDRSGSTCSSKRCLRRSISSHRASL